MNWKCKK